MTTTIANALAMSDDQIGHMLKFIWRMFPDDDQDYGGFEYHGMLAEYLQAATGYWTVNLEQAHHIVTVAFKQGYQLPYWGNDFDPPEMKAAEWVLELVSEHHDLTDIYEEVAEEMRGGFAYDGVAF